jgi:hypothetical protein
MRLADAGGELASAGTMRRQLVYAETSIWNELCNQATDPRILSSILSRQGEQLVLGMNVFFEMAKTFGLTGEESLKRASQLFSYLKGWMDDDFPIVRQTPEILAEEAMHSQGDSISVRVFLGTYERRSLTEEIGRLASGNFDSPRQGFIASRKAIAKRARDEMRADFRAKPDVQSRLRKIPVARLDGWLTEEARSERGMTFLAGHLAGVLPENMFPNLDVIAGDLLASGEYRVSHALVRNGIYLNWRLAHRGSVPTSSFDDAYHVVNASYCSKFLTTDRDQAEQASHSLPGVRVHYYDEKKPLQAWLSDNVR